MIQLIFLYNNALAGAIMRYICRIVDINLEFLRSRGERKSLER